MAAEETMARFNEAMTLKQTDPEAGQALLDALFEENVPTGRAIRYRLGATPEWLQLSKDRAADDQTIAQVLTRGWGSLPLFRMVEGTDGASGYIGWYLLYNPDAVVDSKHNETAIRLYRLARCTETSPRVLRGTVILVSMPSPFTNPAEDRELRYADVASGADIGDHRWVSEDPQWWPEPLARR